MVVANAPGLGALKLPPSILLSECRNTAPTDTQFHLIDSVPDAINNTTGSPIHAANVYLFAPELSAIHIIYTRYTEGTLRRRLGLATTANGQPSMRFARFLCAWLFECVPAAAAAAIHGHARCPAETVFMERRHWLAHSAPGCR